MNISFKTVNRLYPDCTIEHVDEMYHPERKWTNFFNSGIEIKKSGLNIEQQIEKCVQDGAIIVQLYLKNIQTGETHYSDYKIQELIS